MLKADGLQNPVVDFSNAQVQPGNLVMAIGRAPDSGVNATMGVISAVSGGIGTILVVIAVALIWPEIRKYGKVDST